MRQIIPCGFNLTSKVFEINNEYFVMIPKNASNTILFGTEFNANAINFSQLDINHKIVNVFIRDPISRFSAGLVESIKRCSPFIFNNFVASRSSVPTSKDIDFIYGNVMEELNKDSKKYILKILDLLSKSFYDPHLCPQWYFFTSLDARTICKSKLFLLDDLDNVMLSLNLKIDRSYNLNSSFDTEKFKKNKINTPKQFVKQSIVKSKTFINKFFTEFYFRINPNSSICSPSLEPVFNYISFNDWQKAKRLINKRISEDAELKSYIRNLYIIDHCIFDNLKKNKVLTIPERFNLYEINNFLSSNGDS